MAQSYLLLVANDINLDTSWKRLAVVKICLIKWNSNVQFYNPMLLKMKEFYKKKCYYFLFSVDISRMCHLGAAAHTRNIPRPYKLQKGLLLKLSSKSMDWSRKKCSLHMDSALNKSLGSTLLSWATAAISNFNYSNNNHINIESGKTPIKMQSCNIDGSLKSAPFV